MPERCVDASVALKWVLRGEAWRKKAREFLRDSVRADFVLVAPPSSWDIVTQNLDFVLL